MEDKSYAKMKGYMLGQPRLVNSDGMYEVVGRASISPIDKQVPELSQKIAAKNNHIYSYEFGGDDVLQQIDLVLEIKKNHIGNKPCTLFTPATAEYWDDEKLKEFDKIIIKRLSMNDWKNSQFLRTETLSESDYLNMDEKIKSKIVFFVDYEHSDISNCKDENGSLKLLFEFIDWAKNLGVEEVIFLEREKGVREFPIARNSLILSGWHLKAAKATEEAGKLYSLMAVENSHMKIVFKTRVFAENSDIWNLARVHYYYEIFN